jgi:hypothetical protein
MTGASNAWHVRSMAFSRKSKGIGATLSEPEADDGLCDIFLGGDGNEEKSERITAKLGILAKDLATCRHDSCFQSIKCHF